MRTTILIFAAAALLAGCENENLNVQLSKATSEADKHTGVILYSGYSFQLVRVKIDGADYIAQQQGRGWCERPNAEVRRPQRPEQT